MTIEHQVEINGLKCSVTMPEKHEPRYVRPTAKVEDGVKTRTHEFGRDLSFDGVCNQLGTIYREKKQEQKVQKKKPKKTASPFDDMDIKWVRAVVQEVRINLRKLNINNQELKETEF